MKKIIVVSCLLLVVSCSAWAMQPIVVGGVRDGLAIGIMAKSAVAKNMAVRFGVEGNTGKQPLIVFFGGKFYLTRMGGSPMSFGVGAVAYTGGDKTDAGLSLSLIFDRAFNVTPLLFECGVDVAEKGRLLAQFGYKIY
jgi:hypothetical protein